MYVCTLCLDHIANLPCITKRHAPFVCAPNQTVGMRLSFDACRGSTSNYGMCASATHPFALGFEFKQQPSTSASGPVPASRIHIPGQQNSNTLPDAASAWRPWPVSPLLSQRPLLRPYVYEQLEKASQSTPSSQRHWLWRSQSTTGSALPARPA